jgi:ketosteroid isomerase-like protein
VISWRFSGQGIQSGAAVELRLTSVNSLRDGMIVRIRNYPDTAAALEAVGLSE